MFRKKCSRCYRKISKSYDFCPFCGNTLGFNKNKEEYGMLGKDDFVNESDFFSSNTSFFDSLIGTAIKELPSMIKMIEKQMQESIEKQNKPVHHKEFPNNLRIQFFVNGKKAAPFDRKTSNIHNKPLHVLSKEKMERFSKLPREEPVSKMRRLSGKIIYELSVPGVKDINDVLINQLENSIEIKAFCNDKIYSKIINVNLPIIRYGLDKNFLIVELDAG